MFWFADMWMIAHYDFQLSLAKLPNLKLVISCMCPARCVLTLSPQMNDNQIDNWSDLDELKNAKSLETVYLERNPLQKDPQYRRKIMLALPSVRQIDATFIRF